MKRKIAEDVPGASPHGESPKGREVIIILADLADVKVV